MTEKPLPPDPAALTAPVLFAGAWIYPPAFGEDDRRAWEGIQGRRLNEAARTSALLAEQAAAASSPAALLAAARGEADEAQRTRERTERAAKGAAVWARAVEQFGDRVRKVATVEGDVIIIRRMTQTEADMSNARATNLAIAAGKNPLAAHAAFLGAHRDALLDTVVGDKDTRARAKELCERYSAFWGHLEAMRDEMIDGRMRDEGKEPAP